ncbi:hypothetical protein scyTo_0021758 [Scyliorhinus torazame]|uniref:Uncharacterized protein n=1 Tax=Scyliorhinus torazame TaxID=75743 RepID=A0A401Q6E6_SCYTO|nr:hypothetical protein [Scyliorhinus torazame]
MASVGEHLAWCSLLLVISLGISDSASQCPRRLDCTLRRRHPCPTGSPDCGRCLPHYREDQERKCVLAGQHSQQGEWTLCHLIYLVVTKQKPEA